MITRHALRSLKSTHHLPLGPDVPLSSRPPVHPVLQLSLSLSLFCSIAFLMIGSMKASTMCICTSTSSLHISKIGYIVPLLICNTVNLYASSKTLINLLVGCSTLSLPAMAKLLCGYVSMNSRDLE